MVEINRAAGQSANLIFRKFYEKQIYNYENSVFQVKNKTQDDSAALKTQFTLKWTGSYTVKENFPVIEPECVTGDSESPKATSGTGHEKQYGHTNINIWFHQIISNVEINRIKNHFPP